MLQLIIVVTVLLALAFAGFAIKMFFKKGGEFRKQCASMDPATGKPLSCVCGDREDGSNCENRAKSNIKSFEISDQISEGTP